MTTVDQADMRALVSRQTVLRHGATSLYPLGCRSDCDPITLPEDSPNRARATSPIESKSVLRVWNLLLHGLSWAVQIGWTCRAMAHTKPASSRAIATTILLRFNLRAASLRNRVQSCN